MNNRIRKTEKDFEVVYEEPLKRNLYNRLTEQYSIKLDAIATTYPSIYGHLVRRLKELNNWMELTIEDAIYMRDFLNLDLNNFYTAFKE